MLTTKQKAHLRSLANPLKALVLIGKDGLTFNVTESTKTALDAHELVKISVLKSCPTDIRELMLDLVTATKAEVVTQIGRTLVLYRPSEKKRIALP
jgi:RNA-binding protein